MKKSLTELSEKELLDIVANEPSKIKVYSWPNDVLEFISVYNLKTGEERIIGKLLYKLYKLWSKNPINKKTFVSTLTDLFPSMQNGPNLAILLDKKALDLKQEAYNYVKPRSKVKDKGWIEHFQKYLSNYSIKKGSFFVKDIVLYKLYSQLFNKKHNPLGLVQFNNFCKMYFTTKLIKKNYWFGLNETIQNHLTEELINEMRKDSAIKENKKIKL